MRRNFATIIVGLFFLCAGIIIGGNMLGLFHFKIDSSGWWTIFIIAPALISIAQGGLNAGNAILLAIGVILLLDAQGVFPGGVPWKLVFPIALLAVGAQLLFGDRFYRRSRKDRRRDGRDEDA